MPNYKIASILILFLANIFLFNQNDSSLSLIVNILSLITVLFLLMSADKSEPRVDEIAEEVPSDEHPFPLEVLQEEETHDDDLLRSYLELIQAIMKFEGILYFEFDSDEKQFRIKHALCMYASINTAKTFAADEDYPGVFINHSKELFSNEISDQKRLRYYASIEKKREEIFGVPHLQNGSLKGLFIFDSVEKNAFNEEIIAVLTQFIQLFQNSQKNNIPETSETSDKLHEALSKLYELANSIYHEDHFYELLKHIISKLFNAKNFFVIQLISEQKARFHSILGHVEFYKEKDIFSLDEGLIGWSIKNKKFISVDRLIQDNQFTVRFSQAEKKPVSTKSLIFQPIFAKKSFGIGLESDKENAFSDEDKRYLQELSPALEVLFNECYKRSQLKRNSLWDSEQILYSLTAFKSYYSLFSQLEQRHEAEFSIFAIQISYPNFTQESQQSVIFKYIVQEVKKLARRSDILFKYDIDCLLLLLPFTSDAKLEELNRRISTRLNSARILIDNQYKEPSVQITEFMNCSDISTDDFLMKIHVLKNSKDH